MTSKARVKEILAEFATAAVDLEKAYDMKRIAKSAKDVADAKKHVAIASEIYIGVFNKAVEELSDEE